MIINESKKINMSYESPSKCDGRLISAIKEKDFLDKLSEKLIKRDKNVEIERPRDRYWYDIKINGIPINLKITNGGTDNAFNKMAIMYTITGKEHTKKSIDYNKWYSLIMDENKKKNRDHSSEYHYLVVMKSTHKILLKSILDIHTYKSNPSNVLQINWTNEFKNINYIIGNEGYNAKIINLLQTIQKSLIQYNNGMNIFTNKNIETDF